MNKQSYKIIYETKNNKRLITTVYSTSSEVAVLFELANKKINNRGIQHYIINYIYDEKFKNLIYNKSI